MIEIEILLNEKWILRKDNPELYLKLKDESKYIRELFQDKLGYSLIITPQLIKLEKIPGKAEIWMGIEEFKTIQEYKMYCYVLMFLEEKERDEQFILSNLTEYISMQFKDKEVSWTVLANRRQLVRVIKYCISINLFEPNDGDEDDFIKDYQSEVLYLNTGISHYVLRNFMRDIMEYQSPKDFEKSEWYNMDENRGIIRKHRVYRRLLLSPGVYRNLVDDEDFAYIRNYRRQIEVDLNKYFPCELHVHSSSAFIRLEDDCGLNNTFPTNSSLSDLILYVLDEFRKAVKKNHFELGDMERVIVKYDIFDKWLKKIIKQIIIKLPKKYQDEELGVISKMVIDKLYNYGFINIEEDNITLYPICAKIGGNY